MTILKQFLEDLVISIKELSKITSMNVGYWRRKLNNDSLITDKDLKMLKIIRACKEHEAEDGIPAKELL